MAFALCQIVGAGVIYYLTIDFTETHLMDFFHDKLSTDIATVIK